MMGWIRYVNHSAHLSYYTFSVHGIITDCTLHKFAAINSPATHDAIIIVSSCYVIAAGPHLQLLAEMSLYDYVTALSPRHPITGRLGTWQT